MRESLGELYSYPARGHVRVRRENWGVGRCSTTGPEFIIGWATSLMFPLRSWDTVARLLLGRETLLRGLTRTSTWNCGIKGVDTWNNLNTHLKQLFQTSRRELSSSSRWSPDKVTKRVNGTALNLIDCRFLGLQVQGVGCQAPGCPHVLPKLRKLGPVIRETHGS